VKPCGRGRRPLGDDVRNGHIHSEPATAPRRQVNVARTVVRAVQQQTRLQRHPGDSPTALNRNPLSKPIVANAVLPAHLATKGVVPEDVQDPRAAWKGAGRGVQLGLPGPETEENAEARVVNKRARPVRGQTAPEAGRRRRADAFDPDWRRRRGGTQKRKEGPIGRS